MHSIGTVIIVVLVLYFLVRSGVVGSIFVGIGSAIGSLFGSLLEAVASAILSIFTAFAIPALVILGVILLIRMIWAAFFS